MSGWVPGGFLHAFRGLLDLVLHQRNARFHLLATVAFITVFALLGVSYVEWAVLALAAGLVWAAEAANTALEHLADRVAPETHPLVARSKDVAAAAVLIASMGAAAAGILIFLSHV